MLTEIYILNWKCFYSGVEVNEKIFILERFSSYNGSTVLNKLLINKVTTWCCYKILLIFANFHKYFFQ